MAPMIPTIDIAPLFGPACGAREAVDRAIAAAAAETGFMAVRGAPSRPAQVQRSAHLHARCGRVAAAVAAEVRRPSR